MLYIRNDTVHNIYKYAKRLVVTAMVATGCCLGAIAQQQIDPSELSLSENIGTPEVSKKATAPIQHHMQTLADKLAPHYPSVTMVRDGMGLCVTIPCSDLFAPNGVDIKPSGRKYLRPFTNVVNKPTMYKVLVAVYSDDTGEDEYLDALTADRAMAIDQFFCDESHTDCPSVIPYGMGCDDPVADNNTIAHRAANRRVEIYILPEWQMVDNAKSGRLR